MLQGHPLTNIQHKSQNDFQHHSKLANVFKVLYNSCGENVYYILVWKSAK